MSKQNEINCLNKVIENINKDSVLLSRYPFLTQLLYAEPNNDPSRFPDFYIKDGIVEHFMVDGSKKDKRGSRFKSEEAKRDKLLNSKMNEDIKEACNNPQPIGTFQTISETDEYTDFSYDNFINSFKQSFESHISSLKKSKAVSQKLRIFLIEQQGSKMVIERNKIDHIFYKLSLDRLLLSYLTHYKDLLDYIVFYNIDEVEVIDMLLLDKYISSAPKKMDVTGGRFIKEKLTVIINPNLLFK